jgi:hypothetical protein
MNKPVFVISCPFDTYSGYGARSRDIVKALIELNKYDIKLLPQRWGSTSWGFCKDHPEWKYLLDYSLPKLDSKPNIWMQITIPNEFQPVGDYNIGCTAGIEADACKLEWVEGLNKMDINLVSSTFAKNTFEKMVFEKKSKQNPNQVISTTKLEKPIHVIFEGVNLDIYKPLKKSELSTFDFSSIKESFCYLFVGHWLGGSFGHDRKNIGVLVKNFFEAFKGQKSQPALILKSCIGRNSYLSREELLQKIKVIKKSYPKGTKLPNVYIFNGNLSDEQINDLYNHPKVKSMVSFTKGEGYGRPLAEFGLSKKPIIASGWSGHVDFLTQGNCILLPGDLEPVHESAANQWLLKETQWFKVNDIASIKALKDVYSNYKKYTVGAKKHGHHIKTNFSFDAMKELLGDVLKKNLPLFPSKVELILPKLKTPKL